MSYQPKVYRSEGGNKQTIASGGTLSAESGSTVTIAGTTTLSGTITISGTATLSAMRTIRTVEAHTSGDTLTSTESGTVHTNTGASGTITIVLPDATVGQEFFFQVGAAQELRLDPNTTQTISLPSTGVAGGAGKYLVADAIGETVHLMCCIAGTWAVMGYTGTWTAEA